MLPVLFFRLYELVQALRLSWARDGARQEKLESLFKAGRLVKSKSTGRVYRVACAEMCYAILTGESGKRVIVDWLTPAGTLRLEVADNWTAASDAFPAVPART